MWIAVDFLRDLQEEFRNWEADLNSEEKPKSLWEELAVSSYSAKIYGASLFHFFWIGYYAMQVTVS